MPSGISGKPEPIISIILINWNNFEDTADCLRSIQESSYPNIEIFLVDNGSTDDSFSHLKSDFPDVNYLSADKNVGFPAANNIGIKTALEQESDYIFILNNDTLLPQNQDLIDQLVNDLEVDGSVGIVSPLITHYPETNKIWFAQGKVDRNRAKISHRRMGTSVENEDFPDLIENDCLSGCAMLVRASVFEEVGLLSGSYFLRLSDTEFSLRVADAGYKLLTDTRVKLYHKASNSSGERFALSYYEGRNRWRVVRNEFATVAVVFYFWWVLKAVTNRLRHGKFEAALDLCLGVIDGIAGKDGKAISPSERV